MILQQIEGSKVNIVMATKMVLYFPSDDLVKQQWNMLKYYLLKHKGTNCQESHLLKLEAALTGFKAAKWVQILLS